MKITEPLFQLHLTLPGPGSRGRLPALHQQLRAAILDGRLQAGLRLPATRALATALGVSRNTVLAAYDLLFSEGYLVARQGAGTFVAHIRVASKQLIKSAKSGPVKSEPMKSAESDPRLNTSWRFALAAARGPRSAPARYNFALGKPDTTLFPTEVWRRLSTRALRKWSTAGDTEVDTQGQLALRAAIAQHVSFTRAVACDPQHVIVTSGSQQAFDLLARVLITPKRTVAAVEDPGYPPLRAALEMAGANVAPVPVDLEGLVVERLPKQARIICVTPSHQFPLGCAMSMARRAALLEFASRCGGVIIEDDYDAEYRYGGRPLDALQTLDRQQSVFYVGTFNKCLFSSLRMGYIVAPPWAVKALVAAKECIDWHGAGLAQAVLAAFITEGHLARHIRKMRGIYAARREVLLARLARHFADVLQPVPNAAGLHLCALTRTANEAAALIRYAHANDIELCDLKIFSSTQQKLSGVVFGFGAINERDIGVALTRLANQRYGS